jgi:hypothetical protein
LRNHFDLFYTKVTKIGGAQDALLKNNFKNSDASMTNIILLVQVRAIRYNN